MSDFLDSVLSLESSAVSSASEVGAAEGKGQAVVDGRNLGEMKGWELGLELGFMKGACLEWMPAGDDGAGGGGGEDGEAKARIRRLCEAVVKAVDAFSRANLEGEDTELKLQVARAKFRVVRARVRMQGVDLEKVLDGGQGRGEGGGMAEKGGGAKKISSEF